MEALDNTELWRQVGDLRVTATMQAERIAELEQRLAEIQAALQAHYDTTTSRMQTTDADQDLWIKALDTY